MEVFRFLEKFTRNLDLVLRKRGNNRGIKLEVSFRGKFYFLFCVSYSLVVLVVLWLLIKDRVVMVEGGDQDT